MSIARDKALSAPSIAMPAIGEANDAAVAVNPKLPDICFASSFSLMPWDNLTPSTTVATPVII